MLPPGGRRAPSLQALQARARRLAATLASRFNAAAEAIHATARAEAAPLLPTPRTSPGSGAATSGGGAGGGGSPASAGTAATDPDMVLVEHADVASAAPSGGGSPSGGGGAVAAAAAAAASAMDLDRPAAGSGGGAAAAAAALGVGEDEAQRQLALAAAVARLGLGLECALVCVNRSPLGGMTRLRELLVSLLPGLLLMQDLAGEPCVLALVVGAERTQVPLALPPEPHARMDVRRQYDLLLCWRWDSRMQGGKDDGCPAAWF